jgi:hypothetical protein
MSNVIYCNKTQVYGYNDGTSDIVAITLSVRKNGGSIIQIITHIDTLSYTIPEIWALVIASWNAHSWGNPSPVLTINHTDGVGTRFSSASTIRFVSLRLSYAEGNYNSQELSRILGLDDAYHIGQGDGVVSVNWTAAQGVGVELPYMGLWPLQTEIDTGYDFSSQCGDIFEVNIEGENNTDVTRTGVYSGNVFTARGMGFIIEGVKFKMLKWYDDFVEFAGDNKVTCKFEWGLFDEEHTFSGYIYQPETMKPTLKFKVERLFNYKIALIPESHLQI